MAVHEMLTVGGGVLWVGEVADQRRGDRSAAWCSGSIADGYSQPTSAPVTDSNK